MAQLDTWMASLLLAGLVLGRTRAESSVQGVPNVTVGAPYGCPCVEILHGCEAPALALRLPDRTGYLCSVACGYASPCPQAPAGVQAQPMCALDARDDDEVWKFCGLVCESDTDCPDTAFCAAVGATRVCAYRHVLAKIPKDGGKGILEALLEGTDGPDSWTGLERPLLTNPEANPLEGLAYGYPTPRRFYSCSEAFVPIKLPTQGGYLCAAACGPDGACPAGLHGARAHPECVLHARSNSEVGTFCGLVCTSDSDCLSGGFCSAVGNLRVCAFKEAVALESAANETLAEQSLEGPARMLRAAMTRRGTFSV